MGGVVIARWLVGLAVAGVATVGGLAYRSRDDGSRFPEHVDADLVEGGERVRVLGFTSPLCHACERTGEIVAEAIETCDELSDEEVGYREVDVSERADLAEALDVRRTPTLLVLDAEDRVRLARETNPDVDELSDSLAKVVAA